MKKNFFPMALMAIAMGLNACSSDDPVVNAGGGKAPFADGGYVKMAINMPSAPSSRAANDDFVNSDGLAKEYEVKNATLLLFKGTTEDDAIFHSAYNLGDLHMANDGSTQVTTITRIVKTVDKTVPDENLYGYVVLNHNDVLSLGSSATELTVNGKKMWTADNGTAFDAATEIKDFAGFRNAVITDDKNLRDGGFFMGNAPLLDKAGGDAAPAADAKLHTLVNLSKQVYKSKAEAENAKAAEVFVERAVAKVTLDHKEGTLTGGDITVSGSLPMTNVGTPTVPNNKVGYSIDGWVLDVTNKKSFLGRDYSTAWNAYATEKTPAPVNKYRFVGSSALRDGVSRFRTYWGTDPNYNSFDLDNYAKNFVCCKTKKGNDPVVGADPTFKSEYGEDHPQYCFENTFDVDNMQTRQMTRAIVKVKFFGGKTFYTFNDDKTSLYDYNEMSNRVKGVILNNVDVINTLKTTYPGGTVTADDVELDFKDPNPMDNKVILRSVKVKRPTGAASSTPEETTISLTGTNFNTQFGIGDIVEYVNGIAYYPITIKHFGDDLTPWSNKTATKADPYGTTKQSENFLGRYGVLRNNWYNITISSIKNVGSAVVPEIKIDDPTTGDKTDNYISVRINVLSWAKRTQNEEL